MAKDSRRHVHTALVKYDPHQRQLTAPFRDPEIPVEAKKNRFHKINAPLSTSHFVYSHIFILILSLIFLGGLYFVLNKDQFLSTGTVLQYIPVTRKPTTFNLEINNPENELLSYSRTTVLSGTTSAKTTVLIIVEGSSETYDVVEANTKGEFQRTITLLPGLNTITVTAVDGDGNTKSEERIVYYSEEVLP